MKSIIFLAIVFMIQASLSEGCDLIKFSHNNGKSDFYERLEGKTCNGEPIYKMLGDVFFMYKLPNSDYWCDAYTPSKLVLCHSECDEVRFKIDNLYSRDGIVPEEYNGHFDEWIKVDEDKLICNDVAEFENVFVHDSPLEVSQDDSGHFMGQIQEKFESFNQNSNEKKIDGLMETVKSVQNHDEISTNTDNSLSQEDKYILSVVNFLPSFENARMERIRNDIMNVSSPVAPLVTASRFITGKKLELSKPDKKLTKEERLTKFMEISHNEANDFFNKKKNPIKKQDIINNRDNSCVQIELEIINSDSEREGSLVYDLVPNIQCLSFPVYQSEQMFLFRNAFGEWCQKEMDQFRSSIECFRRCKSILLGPGKIKSPIESSLVTVFVKDTTKVFNQFNNHRYVCKSFKKCNPTLCKNGGECIDNDGKLNPGFRCSCPYFSTGEFCEKIIDACHSNPCLNNGICSSKPFQNPSCECTDNFIGSHCEIEVTKCKSNPCKNGGECLHLIKDNTTMCSCSDEYTGMFCELPKYESCNGKFYGQRIPHPKDTRLFLICLKNGHYQVSPCPTGLVFNGFSSRCDYDTDEKISNNACNNDINPCQNQGTCLPVLNSTEYTCECKEGFEGDSCEINIDDCANDPCGDNGKCVDLNNSHICICEDNRYGENCDDKNIMIPCTDRSHGVLHFSYPYDRSIIVKCDLNGKVILSKCASNLIWNPSKAACDFDNGTDETKTGLVFEKCLHKTCQNNGKCVVDKDENAVCECESGYEGDVCEINIDECSSSPCMNNGKCVDGVNSYFCVCDNKFIDKDCSSVSGRNPCQNVLNEFKLKKDKTVRYPHPFTKEKFIVCNLEAYAQVLDCPKDLIWEQNEETCALKNDRINGIYEKICASQNRENLKLSYPYSQLKYAICLSEGYEIRECPRDKAFYCDKTSKCVHNPKRDCTNERF